ncbi:MAG: hypothetical protein C0467_07125 [Planctomycetaceae bacterium]|nr:hypothetical protein [Planctomycetaceae bacterium]
MISFNLLAIVFVVCALDLRPLDLGSLTVERARGLDGKPVTVSLVVATPPYTLLGRTMVGAAERDDGAERGAVLLGHRLDVKEGQRLTVRGRLRLLWHRGDVVNGVVVAGWWEVRVEE